MLPCRVATLLALPHLRCSLGLTRASFDLLPPSIIGGGGDGVDQHDDTRRVGGCAGRTVRFWQPEGTRTDPGRIRRCEWLASQDAMRLTCRKQSGSAATANAIWRAKTSRFRVRREAGKTRPSPAISARPAGRPCSEFRMARSRSVSARSIRRLPTWCRPTSCGGAAGRSGSGWRLQPRSFRNTGRRRRSHGQQRKGNKASRRRGPRSFLLRCLAPEWSL